MRGITFGTFSLAEPLRGRRPDNSEPRLFTEPARPIEDDAIGEQEAHYASPAAEDMPGPAATVSAPDGRLIPAATGFPPATLFYSALIGLVAVLTIGAFFGVGLLLLTPADKGSGATQAMVAPHPPPAIPSPTSAISHPPAAIQHPPPPSRHLAAANPPVPAGSRMPQPVTTPPTPPVAAAPKPAATAMNPPAESPPPQPVTTAQGGPPSPVAFPPTPALAVPPQKPPVPVAAAPDAVAGAHSAVGHRTASRAERYSHHYRRLAEPHREWRHWHARSAHFDHPRQPPQPRVAHAATPDQAGEAQTFDQLLTSLTGPAQGSGQAAPAAVSSPGSLTPPAPGQPNPFAEDGGSR
jgi:hypothetical protein